MKDLFKKDELRHLSVNFILSLPEKAATITPKTEAGLKNEQTQSSLLHQNKKRRLIGGFYKSITRLIE